MDWDRCVDHVQSRVRDGNCVRFLYDKCIAN